MKSSQVNLNLIGLKEGKQKAMSENIDAVIDAFADTVPAAKLQDAARAITEVLESPISKMMKN